MKFKIMSNMMKRIAMVGLLLLAVGTICYADDLSPQSKITEVTVYPGSARVTRKAQVNLSVGEHSIAFENIVPQLDENTLSVSGEGTAAVKIFGAYLKREYLTETTDRRVKELEGKIENLADQIQMEHNNLETLRKEQEFLDSIKLFSGQQIPKDLVTTMPSIENLEQVRSFLSMKFKDIEDKKEAGRIKIRDLKRVQEAAQRQLNELRTSRNQTQRLIVVDVECTKPGKFDLYVSYLVQGAYWRPIYDARASYNEGKVELTSFGMIKQTTGEDWQEVQLTLSTARPSISGRLPSIEPWILRPYQPRQRMMQKAAEAPAGMSASGYMMEKGQLADYMQVDQVSRELKEKAEIAYSEAAQKGISVVYKIARPATIKADGSESKYPIAAQMLKAEFEYSAYPRLKPLAYLGSRVVNSEDLQLLAGQVNLFLEGDFVGKSGIDNVGPGEEFNLYLGVDENIKVKREQVSREMDDILLGGIRSPNKKTTFRYKLTVENYKTQKIKMHLFEAMPVSENERIKVKIFDVSLKPKDKDWKDRKGIWHWEFELEPRAKQEINYSFFVEHPRDMNIPGI